MTPLEQSLARLYDYSHGIRTAPPRPHHCLLLLEHMDELAKQSDALAAEWVPSLTKDQYDRQIQQLYVKLRTLRKNRIEGEAGCYG